MTAKSKRELEAETSCGTQKCVRSSSKSDTSPPMPGSAGDSGSRRFRIYARRRLPAEGEVCRVAAEVIEALRRINGAERTAGAAEWDDESGRK